MSRRFGKVDDGGFGKVDDGGGGVVARFWPPMLGGGIGFMQSAHLHMMWMISQSMSSSTVAALKPSSSSSSKSGNAGMPGIGIGCNGRGDVAADDAAEDALDDVSAVVDVPPGDATDASPPCGFITISDTKGSNFLS